MKWLNGKTSRKIYMDNAGATKVNARVVRAMLPFFSVYYGNPSSIHKSGVIAASAVEKARTKIAKLIFAHPDEILFTGSGTESNALAILGVVKKLNNKPHIVTTNIEHSAVLENCKMLEKEGKAEVTYVEVEENGVVDPKKILDAIKENTVLVSVMYANNEIGTVQPIQEIAKTIRSFRKKGKEGPSEHGNSLRGISSVLTPSHSQTSSEPSFPFFHIDACQAMNYLDTGNMDRLGVDLMSFNGSKIYGPKGVGVLYKRRKVELAPIYEGGGQEFGIRSGTENVGGIVGLALALEITEKIKKTETERLIKIRDYFFTELKSLSKRVGYEIKINGDTVERLPNNVNISVEGISHELLVIELDAKGIEISNKSACKSDDEEHSHVIKAIREASGDKLTQESLRFSLGRETKFSDINKTIKILENILNKYKNLG